jgi:hypothetical protein
MAKGPFPLEVFAISGCYHYTLPHSYTIDDYSSNCLRGERNNNKLLHMLRAAHQHQLVS